MKYISSIEQLALKEGFAQGHDEGFDEGQVGIVIVMIERLLGPVSESTRVTIERLNRAGLMKFAQDLLAFKQPADLQAWFEQNAANYSRTL
ncbi:MAG: DUF4351 domain-containing protein [Anaerolineae bacterium]|nr:DUF4351 domain-containing protein [Anaerolineae bacterium]